jgi:hypothetical protein
VYGQTLGSLKYKSVVQYDLLARLSHVIQAPNFVVSSTVLLKIPFNGRRTSISSQLLL